MSFDWQTDVSSHKSWIISCPAIVPCVLRFIQTKVLKHSDGACHAHVLSVSLWLGLTTLSTEARWQAQFANAPEPIKRWYATQHNKRRAMVLR